MASRLPPLNAIRVFAIVAQRLNFARAAEELGVTQSAVSKQIQTLEDFIGARLFERKAQGVTLTSEGRELREAVLPAIDGLTQSFERYTRRPPRSHVVRITTTASFASLVLLPALGAFEQENADIVVEILAGDRLFDLDREETDFAVRFGPGPWREGPGDALGAQTLTPIASPMLLERHNGDHQSVVQTARRIQVFGKNEWAGFSSSVMDETRPPLFLENFHVAASAAQLGYGVALLPSILLAYELEQKSLTVVGDPVPWSEGFRLLTPKRSLSSPAQRAVNWVKTLVN